MNQRTAVATAAVALCLVMYAVAAADASPADVPDSPNRPTATGFEGFKDFAVAIKDTATTLALVAGGCWAIWKWQTTERIRKSKEMASPDGTLSGTHIDLNDNSSLVTLEAVWRNRGPFAIELEQELSRVSAYQLSVHQEYGPLCIPTNPLATQQVFSSWYILEPNTESVMHKHFVVPKPGVYLFRWIIGIHQKHTEEYQAGSSVVCSRELILDVTSAPCPKPTDGRPSDEMRV